MAIPTREEVNTYMSITGASEPLAFQKLEEYGGNLHDAVSAYFSEGERLITNPAPAVSPQTIPMAVDNNHQNRSGLDRLLPLLSVARTMRASSLFDPNFRRNVSQACTSALTGRTTSTSHPEEAREAPLHFRDTGQFSGYSRPTFADVVRPTSSHYPEIHGNAANGEEYFPTVLSEHNLHDHDVEEEMIKAAIEASKREVIAGHQIMQSHAANDPSGMGFSQSQLELEDDALAHAISASLKTADEEKERHKQHDTAMDQELKLCGLNATSEMTSDGRCKDLERSLGAREASLPPEPALDDENAVYLLLKMPDGSRHGRRFLKSDKLKFLFHFIDISRLVKPGTYRVARPYPRRSFGLDSGSLSLIEVGLTNKQEALYIEII